MRPSLVPAGAPELAGLLTAAALLCLVLYVLGWEQLERLSARRRVKSFVQDRVAPAAGGPEPRRSFNERVVEPLLAGIGRPLVRLTPATVLSSTRENLTQAGDPLALGPFLGIRFGCLVLGFFVAALLATSPELPAPLRVGAPFLGAAAGYMFPGMMLTSAVRGRQKRILKVLSSALEILAVSVEAGLAFDGAIAHVSQRLKGPLSEELRRMFVEFQMGRQRRQAMNDFAKRIGIPEVDRFVAAVIQAEAMGVPLSKALQDLAFELRTLHRQRAETAARTAPIKMMFPLVLLILPSLFIVILGPTIARVLGGVGGF